VGNGLSRASPSEELGEFAERLFACDGGESDDEPPEMGEVGGAENFANAFEESLAERGETVYDEHWIFRVRRHFRKRGKFFNRIIPKYPFLLQEQNAKIPWFYDQTNILWKISDVCVCSLSKIFVIKPFRRKMMCVNADPVRVMPDMNTTNGWHAQL